MSTVAGSGYVGLVDGAGVSASLQEPSEMSLDISGNVYVSDWDNGKIRMVTSSGVVTTLLGDFTSPGGVSVDSAGTLFVGGSSYQSQNNSVMVQSVLGEWTRFARSGSMGNFTASSLAVIGSDLLYISDCENNKIWKAASWSLTRTVSTLAGSGAVGYADGNGTLASFSCPGGLSVESVRGTIYVSDSGNNLIREISSSGLVTTLAGSRVSWGSADGLGSNAEFSWPVGVSVQGSGGDMVLYVADSNNNAIRKVTCVGLVTTVSGSGSELFGDADGLLQSARYSWPYDVSADAKGLVYVSDLGNNKLRKMESQGEISVSGERRLKWQHSVIISV